MERKDQARLLRNRFRTARADRVKEVMTAGGYENIVDLLADIRHWSDEYGENFFEALDQSYRHYVTELRDPKGLYRTK